MKFTGHLKTITKHKYLVMQHCFRVGLYRQGLLHDLSKYSPSEFMVGVRYYQGSRSPNNAEREAIGYSSAWLHHKGRNKHHYEYWIDYSPVPGEKLGGVKMPLKYVIEMFMDRICACKNYQKQQYTDRSPLEYYEKGRQVHVLHEETRILLEKLLSMLAEKGEKVTFDYIRKELLGKNPGQKY